MRFQLIVSRFRQSEAKLLTLVIAALILGLAPRQADGSPITTISVLPSPELATVGDTFLLDLSVSNVTDLFDYQVDVNFDPTILQANDVSDGGFLTSGGGSSVFGGPFVLTLDNSAGLVTVLDSLLGPVPPATGVTGSGTLADISFTAIGPGTTGVGLANLILEDSAGNPIDADTVDGLVVVSAPVTSSVPEPSTLILMASGLAMGLRKLRTRPALYR